MTSAVQRQTPKAISLSAMHVPLINGTNVEFVHSLRFHLPDNSMLSILTSDPRHVTEPQTIVKTDLLAAYHERSILYKS